MRPVSFPDEMFPDVMKNRGYRPPTRCSKVVVESDLHNERIPIDDVESSGKDAMTLFQYIYLPRYAQFALHRFCFKKGSHKSTVKKVGFGVYVILFSP